MHIIYALRALIDGLPEPDAFRFVPHLAAIAISIAIGWLVFGVAQILFWLGGNTLDLISMVGFVVVLLALACFTVLPAVLLPPKLQEGFDIVLVVMGGMLLGVLAPNIIWY